MELKLPKEINKFFWKLFPFVFILISYKNIFNQWELQNYQFNELEDYGSALFVLGVSACETALIVVIIWFLAGLFKKAHNNS